MKRTSRAIEAGAHSLGKKTQDGPASNGVASYDDAGAEAARARNPDDVVRRERDDFVMAASPTLIALI